MVRVPLHHLHYPLAVIYVSLDLLPSEGDAHTVDKLPAAAPGSFVSIFFNSTLLLRQLQTALFYSLHFARILPRYATNRTSFCNY